MKMTEIFSFDGEEIAEIRKAEVVDQLAAALHSSRVSIHSDSATANLIDTELVSKLADCTITDCSDLQADAAWTLIKLASRTPQQDNLLIFDTNTVMSLAKFLSGCQPSVPSVEVAKALGCLASQALILRDIVVSCGVIKPIVELAYQAKNDQDLAGFVQSICKIYRYPLSPKCVVSEIWSLLIDLLLTKNDEKVILEVVRTLENILHEQLLEKQPDKFSKDAVGAGAVPRLLTLVTLFKDNHDIPRLALSCLKYITWSRELIESVIQADALPFLYTVMTTTYDDSIRKEITEIIEQISNGEVDQAEAVSNAGFLPVLVKTFSDKSLDSKCRGSAIEAVLSIMTLAGSSRELSFGGRENIKAFCSVLDDQDSDIVSSSLEMIQDFIAAAQYETRNQPETNRILRSMRHNIYEFGYSQLATLTNSADQDISSQACFVLGLLTGDNSRRSIEPSQ